VQYRVVRHIRSASGKTVSDFSRQVERDLLDALGTRCYTPCAQTFVEAGERNDIPLREGDKPIAAGWPARQK